MRVFREDIQRLPLNGRGVLGLLELSPGTNVTPATRGEAGQFTANGQRPNANYFTVDGASANTGVTAGGLPAQATGGVLPAMSAFGSLDSLLPVEAVDELRVQTSNSMSELGRLPGANVALTSRSGSNEFHGSAVYRFRHELLAANDWFANVSGEPRGPLRLHDVAPSFGGPIRRNRTFFFLSYQHMTLRGSYVSRQPVPSDWPPATARRIWVQPALDLYPQANGPDLGSGLAAWNGRNVRPSQLDSGLARVDHALTSRATLFARYNDSPSFNEFGSTQINRLDLRFQSLTLGLNLRPGTHWTIDLRGNESQAEARLQLGARRAVESFRLRPGADDLLPLPVRRHLQRAGALFHRRRRPGGHRARGHAPPAAVPDSSNPIAWKARRPHACASAWITAAWCPIRRDATGVLSAIADDITSLTDKSNLWLGSSPAIQHRDRGDRAFAMGAGHLADLAAARDHAGLALGIQPLAGGRADYVLSGSADRNLLRPQQPPTLARIATHNFAPRLGAGLARRKSGRTVFRAGGGLFYDSSLSIATDLINSGPFNITQFTNGIHGFVSSLLSYAFAPNLQLPRLTRVEFHSGPGAGRARHALGGLCRVHGTPPVPARSRGVRATRRRRCSRSPPITAFPNTTACSCNTAARCCKACRRWCPTPGRTRWITIRAMRSCCGPAPVQRGARSRLQRFRPAPLR